MRAAIALFLLLFVSAACFSQQPTGNPPTITGCLVGLNGGFILTTHNGQRYVLKGHHNTLLRHNGQQVQVTGPPPSTNKSTPPPNPGEFHVSTIKKLADVCQ
jgi:Protein of unknown function (DUF5818)